LKVLRKCPCGEEGVKKVAGMFSCEECGDQAEMKVKVQLKRSKKDRSKKMRKSSD
jgi:hypothetical protein